MSNGALLIASIALFVASGAVTWCWFAMLGAQVESHLPGFVQGMSPGR